MKELYAATSLNCTSIKEATTPPRGGVRPQRPASGHVRTRPRAVEQKGPTGVPRATFPPVPNPGPSNRVLPAKQQVINKPKGEHVKYQVRVGRNAGLHGPVADVSASPALQLIAPAPPVGEQEQVDVMT